MEKCERILFPVDLSEASPKIAPWVLTVAKKFDATLYLLFVARSFEYLSDTYVSVVSIETVESEFIKSAEAKMEQFATEYFEDYPSCVPRVVVGDATEEILKFIESEEIDLVIMGTHGRKGLERILFGSVADRVIKMSPVPVMSVNPHRSRES